MGADGLIASPLETALKLNRHDLYERCVQNPAVVVRLLRAIHGGDPTPPLRLREDFSARARVSRQWCRDVPAGTATAVDLDPSLLRDLLTKHARSTPPRVKAIAGNALRLPVRPASADIVFVGNFSIGEIHDRPTLVKYLRDSAARLAPGGVFICDTYGGESAFRTGSVQRTHPWARPDSRPVGQIRRASRPSKSTADLRIRYTWEQREANPLSGMVTNAIHFRVFRGSEVIGEITDAFIYHWRLWSVPELRDAMAQAGFASSDVYADVPDAQDSEGRWYAAPLTSTADLPDAGASFIVCVAGRIGQETRRRARSTPGRRA